MNTRTFALIGIIALVAIALVVTALKMTRKPTAPPIFAGPPAAQSSNADPLAPELVRCSELGEAAERDAACLAAWAANRRRFLSGAH